MKRYAVYFAPRDGAFADAAAAWLGWNAVTGQSVAQPAFPAIADHTADPRRYGFHGTIKPPFRLSDGTSPAELLDAAANLATRLQSVRMAGLTMTRLEGFLALIPTDTPAALHEFAAQVVQGLDSFRAPLTDADIARRRPDSLTPRQRELLQAYGYPYVMEQFQFHLTLSGRMEGPTAAAFDAAAQAHFAGLLPQPFVIEDLCLFGEDHSGRFHLLHRYALSA